MKPKLFDASGKPILENNTKKFSFKKSWKIWLPVVFSIISVLAAIYTCHISNRSISLSKKQFFMTNRPDIVIKPVKFKDINSHYGYRLIPEKNAVEITAPFKVKNIGKAGASNLRYTTELITDKFQKQDVSEVVPNKISLSPDEEYKLMFTTYSKMSNTKTYLKLKNSLESKGGIKFQVKIEAAYSNELDDEQTFTSMLLVELHKNRNVIIDKD